MKIVSWTGGDAPNEQAELVVTPQYDGFMAIWEPGYCGCEDCHPIVGTGSTPTGAISEYWARWRDKYPEAAERARLDAARTKDLEAQCGVNDD
jgi:hypothetical protein